MNFPRFVVLIHKAITEQIVVCTEFPVVCAGHGVPPDAHNQCQRLGHYSHPSGDFTIRMEGIWKYIDRYIFGLKLRGRTYVDIVQGFPAMILGQPIPQGLKVVVDKDGYAESDDGNLIIWKEGFWSNDESNASPTFSGKNETNSPCGPSSEELRSDPGSMSHRVGGDSQ